MSTASTCSTCKHFHPMPSIDVRPNAPHGECRRFPPQRSDLIINGQQIYACGFPTVQRNNACGEWRLKLETAP